MSKNKSSDNGSILLRRNQTKVEFTLEDVAKALEMWSAQNIYTSSEVHITDVYGVNDVGMFEVTITLAKKGA